MYLFMSVPLGVFQGSLEAVEDACKVCGSHNEVEETGCDQSVAANGSTSCICPDNTKQGNAAFTPDAVRCLGVARLHVKSMQRRGQMRIRSDGEHEAVDAARVTRLRRLSGAALNARVQFFQLERQIHVAHSRGSQSAVRISACRH